LGALTRAVRNISRRKMRTFLISMQKKTMIGRRIVNGIV
jgi:hypothetical protein